MIKIWLCIAIIALSGYMGRLKSKKIKLRSSCMSEMKEILTFLQADMKNEMMTISQALLKEANAKIFGRLLSRCADMLKENPGKTFYEIWDAGLTDGIKNDPVISLLNREEAALIRKTGKSLVNISIPTQDTYFKMLFLEYEAITEKLKLETEKKTKLYNSLSIMCGIFIAILLI